MATAKSCLFNQLYEFRPALSTAYRYSNIYTGARIFNIYSGTDNIESFNTIQEAIEAGLYPDDQLLSGPISKQQMLKILHGFQGFDLMQRFDVNIRYTTSTDSDSVVAGARAKGFVQFLNENIVVSQNLQKRASSRGAYQLDALISPPRSEIYDTNIIGLLPIYNSGYNINYNVFAGEGFLRSRMDKIDPITYSVSPPRFPSNNPYVCSSVLSAVAGDGVSSTQSQMAEIFGNISRENLTGNFGRGDFGALFSLNPYFIEIKGSYYFVASIFQYFVNWFVGWNDDDTPVVTFNSIKTSNDEPLDNYSEVEFLINNLGIVNVYQLQKLLYGPRPSSTDVGSGRIAFELNLGLALLQYEDFSPDYNYPPKLN